MGIGKQLIKAAPQILPLRMQARELTRARAAVGVVDIGPSALGIACIFSDMIDIRSIMEPAVSLFSRASAPGRWTRRVVAGRGRVDQAQRHQQQLIDAFGGVVARLVVASMARCCQRSPHPRRGCAAPDPLRPTADC